jgi:hypothetical protein
VHVSKLCRGVAVAATACGLAAAGLGSAIAQAATGPTVTISAKSHFPVITHDVLVAYGSPGKFAQVAISGKISGATTGEVAALYAQPFPFKKAPARVAGQTKSLTVTSSSPISYSFSAKPSIATRYTVEVLPSITATSAAGRSPVQNVYVVSNQQVTGFNVPSCARPVCRLSLHVYTHLPASTYAAEKVKPYFVYFGFKLSRTGTPSGPKYISLDRSVTVSKVRRISAREFERTISLSFRIGNDGVAVGLNFCTKDTESKDGLNLPGKHSCGVSKIRNNGMYLG